MIQWEIEETDNRLAYTPVEEHSFVSVAVMFFAVLLTEVIALGSYLVGQFLHQHPGRNSLGMLYALFIGAALTSRKLPAGSLEKRVGVAMAIVVALMAFLDYVVFRPLGANPSEAGFKALGVLAAVGPIGALLWFQWTRSKGIHRRIFDRVAQTLTAMGCVTPMGGVSSVQMGSMGANYTVQVFAEGFEPVTVMESPDQTFVQHEAQRIADFMGIADINSSGSAS